MRRGTATDGTNTRRARGARRAKRPARRSAQTKRIRKPWSSDDHFPSFIPSFVSMLTRKGENERETKKTRKWLSGQMDLSLSSPSVSILLHPAVIHPHHHFRINGAKEEVKEEWSFS